MCGGNNYKGPHLNTTQIQCRVLANILMIHLSHILQPEFAFGCSEKHRDQKHLGEQRVDLGYTSRSQSITEGNQGGDSSRNPGGTLLMGLLILALLSSLSHAAQNLMSRDIATHSPLGPPASTNIKKIPTHMRRCLKGDSLG